MVIKLCMVEKLSFGVGRVLKCLAGKSSELKFNDRLVAAAKS